ncbi:uncharacterized protein LOC120320449 [Drosophila yakuba]|uniref:uncharacterized protein LOC120320449 n=1 Tax=Drosophila yakuba TaxID=7245 RepID=UPI0019307AF5|nr:uncharacterized protein LOC120320449 [Drosophila yakuba]
MYSQRTAHTHISLAKEQNSIEWNGRASDERSAIETSDSWKAHTSASWRRRRFLLHPAIKRGGLLLKILQNWTNPLRLCTTTRSRTCEPCSEGKRHQRRWYYLLHHATSKEYLNF